jgi:hypothetical protein
METNYSASPKDTQKSVLIVSEVYLNCYFWIPYYGYSSKKYKTETVHASARKKTYSSNAKNKFVSMINVNQ